MEVDGDDVSAGLLAQLGSLQAADHDDLVSQMLSLVGSESLSVDNARFYLEMNGWNVQVRRGGARTLGENAQFLIVLNFSQFCNPVFPLFPRTW